MLDNFLLTWCRFCLSANGFWLAEGAKFEIRMFKITIMYTKNQDLAKLIPTAHPCYTALLLVIENQWE